MCHPVLQNGTQGLKPCQRDPNTYKRMLACIPRCHQPAAASSRELLLCCVLLNLLHSPNWFNLEVGSHST
jgi:hypothetical protein